MPTKSRNRRSPKKLARRMKPTRRLSRKKGSGKKCSARARNSKKMRGGVTRRRLSQLTQQELLTAVRLLSLFLGVFFFKLADFSFLVIHCKTLYVNRRNLVDP